MSQYIPILEVYGGGLPLVSPIYASTECVAGINLRPLDPPSHVSYALLPNIAYFEFLEVMDENGEKVQGTTRLDDNLGEVKVVDLVDVKVGRCYELIVTTFAGKLLGYFLSLFFSDMARFILYLIIESSHRFLVAMLAIIICVSSHFSKSVLSNVR